MLHQWQHDPTAGGSYQPKECSGVAQLDLTQAQPICTGCGRPEGAHNGIPFTDHSKCLLTCSACGETHPCNKLYPENRYCLGENPNKTTVGDRVGDSGKA